MTEFKGETFLLLDRCGRAPQKHPSEACPGLRSEFIRPCTCLPSARRVNDVHSLFRRESFLLSWSDPAAAHRGWNHSFQQGSDQRRRTLWCSNRWPTLAVKGLLFTALCFEWRCAGNTRVSLPPQVFSQLRQTDATWWPPCWRRSAARGWRRSCQRPIAASRSWTPRVSLRARGRWRHRGATAAARPPWAWSSLWGAAID